MLLNRTFSLSYTVPVPAANADLNGSFRSAFGLFTSDRRPVGTVPAMYMPIFRVKTLMKRPGDGGARRGLCETARVPLYHNDDDNNS